MVIRLGSKISEKQARSLKVGDLVTITGTIYTGRDQAHIRMLKNPEKADWDLRGGVLFHCGPLVEKNKNGWRVVGAGPTTSSRMNSLEPSFIEKTGVRAIIGKGGMNKEVSLALKKHGCVYLAFTGGCAVLAAEKIVSVEKVHWLDLGVPEAVWELRVKDFGPMIVAMDAKGNTLYK